MGRCLTSKRQRALLYYAQDGLCAECEEPLPENWHADHIIPYSKTGRTNVHEMQALCPRCNLEKGPKMPKQYRQMQSDIDEIARAIKGGEETKSILVHGVPGGGKSWLPLILLEHMPKHYRLAWFVPRSNLRTQAALQAKKDFGIKLHDVVGAPENPSRGTRGFITTHASLAQNAETYRDEISRHPYIVVVDEVHHAYTRRNGSSTALTFALNKMQPKIWLLMTGTLDLNHSASIWHIEYKFIPEKGGVIPDGIASADAFVRYTRAEALTENSIVPIYFWHYDGPAKYRKDGADVSTRLSEASDDAGAALFTALQTGYAMQLFNAALKHWRKRGKKLIVVCHRKDKAKDYTAILREQGIKTYLAIDDNNEASEDIQSFRASNEKCACVTCMMAYEGMDVPTATHLCVLTHIRSKPWIYQMLARIWRAAPGKNRCFAFVPDDQLMEGLIEEIRSEQETIVKDGHDGGGEGGSRPNVLALESSADDMRLTGLDNVPESPLESAFIDFLIDNDLEPNDPEFRPVFDKIREKEFIVEDGIEETEGQTLIRMRKEISDLCRSRDNERGLKWGTTQKELYSRTGMSIKEMDEDELKRAFDVFSRLSA